LEDVGICYFMDSVQRLQVYESSTAVMKGMYSGFVDGSKIKPENYNWMRSLNNNSWYEVDLLLFIQIKNIWKENNTMAFKIDDMIVDRI